MIYIQLNRAWWEIGEKSPKETKNKSHLVSLPSPLYGVESWLFSGLKVRPKISRAVPLEGETLS